MIQLDRDLRENHPFTVGVGLVVMIGRRSNEDQRWVRTWGPSLISRGIVTRPVLSKPAPANQPASLRLCQLDGCLLISNACVPVWLQIVPNVPIQEAGINNNLAPGDSTRGMANLHSPPFSRVPFGFRTTSSNASTAGPFIGSAHLPRDHQELAP